MQNVSTHENTVLPDSVAAFLAANVEKAGESVSSLGSTLAVDLLSTTPIDAARYGICSYRWQNNWIVGKPVHFYMLCSWLTVHEASLSVLYHCHSTFACCNAVDASSASGLLAEQVM